VALVGRANRNVGKFEVAIFSASVEAELLRCLIGGIQSNNPYVVLKIVDPNARTTAEVIDVVEGDARLQTGDGRVEGGTSIIVVLPLRWCLRPRNR